MLHLPTLRTILTYTDWSTTELLTRAAEVSDSHLDQDLQIGPGTLRKILLHTYNGELIWLKRCQGIVENPWPGESEQISIADLTTRFKSNTTARNAWLSTLDPATLANIQTYRDSKGTLYKAPLGDMLLQTAMHTKHHQAQAVNALKRLGAEWPELDYMYHVRQPA